MSLSVGIGFWVAHGAFGFSFSMANVKLLKEVKSLPKLSLASSHLEYFDWEKKSGGVLPGSSTPTVRHILCIKDFS